MLKISKLKMGTVLVASLMTCALSSTSQAAVNEKKSYESSTDIACLNAALKVLTACRNGNAVADEGCVSQYNTSMGKCAEKMVDAVISVKKTAENGAKACLKTLDALREGHRVTWATTKCSIGGVGNKCRNDANDALVLIVPTLSNNNSAFNQCLTGALRQ